MTIPVKNSECRPDVNMIRRWVGDSKNWLNSFLKELPSTSNVVSVVAMGSAIRDRGHRRSDVDLLLIYRGKRPSLDHPIEVDIRAYPVERIEDKIAQGHEVIGWAIRYGIAIFDRDNFWHDLQSSWLQRVPLPSRSDALKRGKKSLSLAEEMLDAGDDSAAEDLILAAITQFARARLIGSEIYPASRPELPFQLREVSNDDDLAPLLEDAMYSDRPAVELIDELKSKIELELSGETKTGQKY